MKTLTFNVPDSFDLDDKEIAMLLATKLYEQGKLSLGQAAELVGLSKRTFAELFGAWRRSGFQSIKLSASPELDTKHNPDSNRDHLTTEPAFLPNAC